MKNKNVVYNGKVGKNMGPKRIHKSTACKKAPCVCKDGPMTGETLYFGDSTFTSCIFTYKGQTGRYVKGEWVK